MSKRLANLLRELAGEPKTKVVGVLPDELLVKVRMINHECRMSKLESNVAEATFLRDISLTLNPTEAIPEDFADRYAQPMAEHMAFYRERVKKADVERKAMWKEIHDNLGLDSDESYDVDMVTGEVTMEVYDGLS